MDPTEDRMSSAEAVSVSKKMFWGGFLGLPWLWIANYLLFRPYVARSNAPDDLRWYSLYSRVFAAIVFLAAIAWYVTYLAIRSTALDAIALVIPRTNAFA
eukprot:TRINITY_DN8701_c0_g1_i1.p1 TRINITY_DN8701_c0_g1~~TRINITY_DN8701_c0_g1_i1.p1  ORF type:complete len:100 (+),score=12.55 TRINITY_DN8701_c0_g1_i1:81-380(+)